MGRSRQREREWGGGPARELEEPELSLSCGVNSGGQPGQGLVAASGPGMEGSVQHQICSTLESP